MRRLVLVAGFVVTIAGCGASSSSGNDTEAVQGNSTSARPEVGMLMYNGSFGCTATLIAPQVVISASHCANVNIFNDALSFAIETSSGRHSYPIDKSHEWSDAGIVGLSPDEKDVAVYHLTQAVPASLARPAVIASPALSYTEVTEMGYGGAGWGCFQGSGPGNKRYHETIISIGGNSDVCPGDSGGPIFAGALRDHGPIVALMVASSALGGDGYSYPPKLLSEITSQLQSWGTTLGSPLPTSDGLGTPKVDQVDWGQLSTFVPTCNSADMAMSPQCMTAYKRFCASINGDDSGFGPVGKSTTTAAVVCHWNKLVQAHFSDWDTTYSASCNGQGTAGVSSAACSTAVHRHCQSIGMATGYGPVEHSGDDATVACLTSTQANVRQSTYTELVTYHSACDGTKERWGGECNAAIDRLCRAHGFVSGFGPVESSGNNVNIVCVTGATVPH